MHRAEARRCREQDEVYVTINEFLIRVEPHKAAVVGDFQVLGYLFLELFSAHVKTIPKEIAQGDDFDIRCGTNAIHSGARSPTPGADETDA
jgi:hypothetical protein